MHIRLVFVGPLPCLAVKISREVVVENGPVRNRFTTQVCPEYHRFQFGLVQSVDQFIAAGKGGLNGDSGGGRLTGLTVIVTGTSL